MKKHVGLTLIMFIVLTMVVFCSSIIYAENVELVMSFSSGSTYIAASDALIKSFEKENPGIKIKVEGYPYAEILSTTEVRLGAKSTVPDIVFTDAPLVSAYTARGYLLPLNEYFTPEEIKNWVPAARQAVTIGQNIMAAPLNNSSQILYYNKKLFKEMGVAPLSKDPNKRLTWDELVKIAQKLTIDQDGDGVTDVWGFCFNQVNRVYQLLPLPQSLGGEAISADGFKTTGIIDSQEWIKAFQFYQDLFNKYKVSPKGISAGETPTYFTSGKLAMMLGVDFYTLKFMEAKDLDWDYAPHPYFASGKAVTSTGSWCLGVNKYSKHKDAAAKFIHYLTTAPACIDWFKLDGHISPNINTLNYIMESPEYNEWPLDVYKKVVIYEVENTAVPRPVTPGYLEYEGILNASFEDIRNGSDVKETLSNAASRIDRMLMKYKK